MLVEGLVALGAGIAGGSDVILIPEIPYDEENVARAILQRSASGKQFSIVAVSEGALPDTVVLLEHPPVITLGRRTEPGELHVPEGAEVELVETDRGGKSTYHGPGQLICYPIFDLTRHGQDVKRYCRDLEEALVQTLGAFGLEAQVIDGLTTRIPSATAPRAARLWIAGSDACGSSSMYAGSPSMLTTSTCRTAHSPADSVYAADSVPYTLGIRTGSSPFTASWITLPLASVYVASPEPERNAFGARAGSIV